MPETPSLNLELREQILHNDAGGYNTWETSITRKIVPAFETAMLICDMWDNHWSRGAAERVDALAPRFNQVVRALRAKGVHIIHAPSDTMDFYTSTPARQRMLAAPFVEPPATLEHIDPPLPIDDSDGGSDTGESPWHKAWTRQHPAIEIDQDRDGISDDGREVYSWLRQCGVGFVLIAGVHANMCVLNRSFAIKQMVRSRVDVALVCDLTDTMYNPAMRPYVSHAEGTRLVIEYIEKFWCPSVESAQLIA
jgi:nicotinamidase-related amidase